MGSVESWKGRRHQERIFVRVAWLRCQLDDVADFSPPLSPCDQNLSLTVDYVLATHTKHSGSLDEGPHIPVAVRNRGDSFTTTMSTTTTSESAKGKKSFSYRRDARGRGPEGNAHTHTQDRSETEKLPNKKKESNPRVCFCVCNNKKSQRAN